MTAPTYGVLAVTIAIFLAGASMSRLYVSDGRTFIIVSAMILYTIGNLLMIHVMRAVGLGIAVSIATISQLILINVVAFVFFQERPTSVQIGGMVLGAVGMALILLPTSQR